MQIQAAGNWPPFLPADPYYEYVTMLLTGDGTNGAQNNTFLDSSTNNFSITRNGNTTQGSFSPYGANWSNYFDGTGDYLSVPDNAAFDFGSGNFTLEAWINIVDSTPSKAEWIVCQWLSDSDNAWGYRIETDGTLNFYYSQNGSDATVIGSATPGITAGQWAHTAVVRNSGTITVYVNGVSVATDSIAGSLYNSTTTVMVGNQSNTGIGQTFTGYISNVRVVKGTAVYTSTFTPSTTPLTAISGTSLLTCQSNRFIDNSSNAFALTVNGNTSVQRFSPFSPTASYDTATIGGSGYFDGTGDYLETGTSSGFALGTGNFTLECWIYRVSGSGSWRYWFNNLSSGGAGDSEWTVNLDPSNNPAFGTYNTTYIVSSTAIKLNTWNHIAVSRSGSTLSLFLNGVRVATDSNSNNFSATNGANIGAYDDGSTAINAYISDCRVVKGTAVYDPTASTCTVPTTPLTAITNTQLLCNMTNAGIPDSAMMNNLETVGDAQVSTSVKKFGTGSLAFDGTGDYLVTPSKPITSLEGNFTIEMWIYRQSGNTYFFSVGDTQTASGIEAYIGSGGTALNLYSNDDVKITASPFATTTWSHLAVVRSGTTITMYVNGTSVGTWTSSATFSGAVYVGAEFYSGSVTGVMNGNIDDLRITKGVARYTANFTAPTAAFPTF
jgi:hypothetical protein